MRTSTTALVFLLPFISALHAADWTPADPEMYRRLGQRSDLVRVQIHFCGKCPKAAKWMKGLGKAVHDVIEREHLPAVLECITPDKEPAQLRAYAQEIGMTGAVFYQDPANKLNISTNNIWQLSVLQPDGAHARLELDEADNKPLVELARAKGKFRISNDALTDQKVVSAWWMVERGERGVVKQIINGAKNRQAPPDLSQLLERVTAFFTELEKRWVAADASIEAYDQLDTLLLDADGLDLKAARERLKALQKEPALKDELTARGAYLKCVALAATGKTQDEKQASAGFAEIARRYPQTRYGKLAGARR